MRKSRENSKSRVTKGPFSHLAIWIEDGRLAHHFVAQDPDGAKPTRGASCEEAACARLETHPPRREAHRELLDREATRTSRCASRRLRYGAEFFADTFKGRAQRAPRKILLRTLENLQDVLGDMNDIAVRQQAFPDSAAESAGSSAAAIDALMPEAQRGPSAARHQAVLGVVGASGSLWPRRLEDGARSVDKGP